MTLATGPHLHAVHHELHVVLRVVLGLRAVLELRAALQAALLFVAVLVTVAVAVAGLPEGVDKLCKVD